jgi:hypothetical protein
MIHEGHEEHQGSAGVLGMTRLIPKDDVCAAMGTAMDVHREPGPGVLEAVHHEALEIALQERGSPFEPWKRLAR